jgi:glycerol-3-phosphate dehydrogenase
VINATGCWAEQMHPSPEARLHLRPLRGSHLMLPAWRLPVHQALTLIHPADGRPLFVIPWEGALLLGTTDIDHGKDISGEIIMDPQEADYMMECLQHYFPHAGLCMEDCISSWAGIRPVLSHGQAAPSKESREHVVWENQGLVTVAGGKLTTFRALAADSLKAASKSFNLKPALKTHEPVFSPMPAVSGHGRGLSRACLRRLYGRYGSAAESMINNARPGDLTEIPGTLTLWAELPVLAQKEKIRHLADLLLRRVRIGILIRQGGSQHLDRIQALCQPVLDWDAGRWQKERRIYCDYWHAVHNPWRRP